MTAVSVGLFDSALHDLWVETMKQLRIRIKQYDMEYFFDVAIPSENRDEFSTHEDLDKVEDLDLLEGARKIELLSEKAYKQLDHVQFMLRYIEQDSGNQAEVSGTQLIAWMEMCIREVITLQIPDVSVQTQLLLKDIKQGILSKEQILDAEALISGMSAKMANVLAKGVYGLYLREDAKPHIGMNVKKIIGSLWSIAQFKHTVL